MSSLKCGNCGLVNFKTAAVCKRCQAVLAEMEFESPAGLSSAPDEQAQAGGVWQDRKKIVLHLAAPLPDRCLKCNSTDGFAGKVYELKYYPAYNIILALFGFVRYKKIGIELGLCAAHRAKRKQQVLTGCSMMAVAIGMGLLGIMWESSPVLLIGGFILFFVGCIYLACLDSPVSISKCKEPYIWLKGADDSYLNSLPQWNNGSASSN